MRCGVVDDVSAIGRLPDECDLTGIGAWAEGVIEDGPDGLELWRCF
jgi:hypothetical protein